jgi:hypothetical protein
VLFELRYAIFDSDASQKHPRGENETFSNKNYFRWYFFNR